MLILMVMSVGSSMLELAWSSSYSSSKMFFAESHDSNIFYSIWIFFNSISFLLKNGVAKTSSWNGNLIRKLFTQSTIYSQFLIQFLPRRVFFCECEKGNLKRSNGQLLLLLVFVWKLFCLNLFLRLKIHFW